MIVNPHSPRPSQKQYGVALLVVMMIMALMTSVAAMMSSRMFINYNRVESQVRIQQAYWFGLSVEELAKVAITESFDKDGAVTLSQPWAVRDQIYPIDDWQIKGSIFDEQACFNLNGLSDLKSSENGTNPNVIKMLQQLIESQGIDSVAAETVAASTWEYIDKDNNVQSSSGVEDNEYEGRKIPRVTANGFLSDVTEWRAVFGVTQAMYEKVSPFLCTIPSSDLKVNVNTLVANDSPLLAALFHPHLSEDNAKSIIEDRDPVNGWTDINSFLANPNFSKLRNEDREAVKAYLDIKSRYFESDIEITLSETSLNVRSLLQLDDDGKVHVIRRRFGGTRERNTDNTTEQ